MDLANVFVKDLEHGESRYDPVKAHEYYLRTRELKGRQSTEGFTDTQKEGLSYVKAKISEERKADFDAAQEAFKKVREALVQRGKDLQDQLRSVMEQISGTASSSRENITKSAQAKIDRLPKIPEGIPESRRLKLVEQRRMQIEKIRGDANRNLRSLNESTRAASERTSEAVNKKREQVRSELKGSLDKAREDYKKLKEGIKAKYEAELDKEYNAIRSNVR